MITGKPQLSLVARKPNVPTQLYYVLPAAVESACLPTEPLSVLRSLPSRFKTKATRCAAGWCNWYSFTLPPQMHSSSQRQSAQPF